MQKGKKHNKNCVFDFMSEKIMVCLHGITLLYRLLTSTCPPIHIFILVPKDIELVVGLSKNWCLICQHLADTFLDVDFSLST
jgi:hypothetical protein